jgi:hypothetical protein
MVVSFFDPETRISDAANPFSQRDHA